MKNPILILGAYSSIAKATAHQFAREGYPLYLAGRNEEELDRMAADIRIRWQVDVKVGFFDACLFAEHIPFMERVLAEMPQMEGVLLAFGSLGDPEKAATDFAAAKAIIDSNYTGACSILTLCANHLSRKKKGFIIVLSSIAGDRGRQSNYVYGSAKAGLNAYLQGLRNRLFRDNIRVITIKLGFVDTPMIYAKPGVILAASPQKIAEGILKTLHRSRDVVYLPRFWRYVAIILKSIPESIFKRLKL